MNIAYFVHGRGRGHAARTYSVLPILKKANFDIHLFAGAMAIDQFGNEKVNAIPSVMPGNGAFSIFIRRLKSDYKILKKLNPDVVISDGDAPSIYIARILGVPSIAVGHGMIVPYFKHPFPLPRKDYIQEYLNVMISSWVANYKIAIHFTELESKNKRVLSAFPDNDFKDLQTEYVNEDFLLSYFRDKNAEKPIRLLLDSGQSVHNFGHPVDGATNFNVDPTEFRKQLLKCKAVIGSSGSNLISEAIFLKKPMFALYKTGDFEQWINAQYLQKYNYGIANSLEKLTVGSVNRFIQFLDQNEAGFERNKTDTLPFSQVLLSLLKNEINQITSNPV